MEFNDEAVDGALEQIGRRVAELRAARGLTQAVFAERIGLQISYVQRVEAGEQNLTVRTLVRLAAALECEHLGELFAAPRKG